MNKKSIKDVNVEGKRVLVRADFNVPLDENGRITDDTRIRASLPTIEYLLKQGARVILSSHLGRPKGQVNAKYSLAPVARRLSERLGQEVALAQDCIGEVAENAVAKLQNGQALLLENLRFHPEEEKNDPEFARKLAALAELFVNDAFGTAHRAHASTEGVTHYLPAVAGFLMQKEVEFMGNALEHPERPFVAIIGGAKVSDKIGVIENLLEKVDALIIGGGMANTFLKAQGYNLGKSLVEEDKLDLAKQLLAKAEAKGVKLELPADVVVAEAFAADAPHRTADLSGIQADEMALDIGPASAERFSSLISTAHTVVWNGPMGVFEMDAFAKGTEKVAQAVAACSGTTIVGGGDSVAAVEKLGVADRLTHISTGGGASLEFLEGKILPGVAALSDVGKRRPVIAGNWKMFKTVKEAEDYAVKFLEEVKDVTTLDIILCAPFTALAALKNELEESVVHLGAQNMSWADQGAYTGEISAQMLLEAACTYVILGHSERREMFGESDEMIARKVRQALAAGLTPILCVGENLNIREQGNAVDYVQGQVGRALEGMPPADLSRIVIAYEPIWAIGTGKTASSQDAQEMCAAIRTTLAGLMANAAGDVPILYGGSVKADNIAELLTEADVDGALVGGASLDPLGFAKLIHNAGSL